ncbi:hypothetical protein SLEP1_g36884 [Rubroshorea leprosula]|uniref:ATP synthase F0 subunit 8 n=1 Tax=Rubroshorea leprosula TaxID=152421 RepID=A0AAV5KT78_9ROSI|nr:hypothetical protein SLEP1_g36884 [Rubroshorea leprosula]
MLDFKILHFLPCLCIFSLKCISYEMSWFSTNFDSSVLSAESGKENVKYEI